MCTTLSNLLPVELCAHIFEFATSPGDLYNICLASRTFACEAQRLLFRSVAIDTHNRRRSFAQSVIAHPSLGRWVHSLAIELVERDDDAHQAFLSLVNLRHLRVSGYTGHSAAFPSSQFLGCPYRLLSFHNYSFNLEGTVKFLLNQPDITNWTHQQSEFYANGEEGVKFSNDFLPNVNSMEVDAEVLAAFSSSRPVTSMKVRFWHLDEEEETRALRDIALFRDTLTTLSLQHWDSNPHVSLTNTVTMLTQGAPNLRRLCLAGFYRNDDWGSNSYEQLIREFSNSLPMLPHLEILVLARDQKRDPDPPREFGGEANILDFVRSMRALSPSLRTLVFPYKWDKESYKLEIYVDSADGTLVRSGQMVSDDFYSWCHL